MKKKTRFILFAIIIVIVVASFAIVGVFKSIEANMQQLTVLHIPEIDLSAIPDGTYIGAHKAIPVIVEVSVTVQSHVITEIQLLKHQNGQGGTADILPSKIIEAQSLQVDMISGATYSSKTILKAVYEALSNASSQ